MMRTTIGAAVLVIAMLLGGVIIASAGGVTIDDLIEQFEQGKRGKTMYAEDGVGRFAQPRLYRSFRESSQ